MPGCIVGVRGLDPNGICYPCVMGWGLAGTGNSSAAAAVAAAAPLAAAAEFFAIHAAVTTLTAAAATAHAAATATPKRPTPPYGSHPEAGR